MTYTYNLSVEDPGKPDKANSCNPLDYATFLNCDVKGLTLKLGYGKAETDLQLELVESLAPYEPDPLNQNVTCDVSGYSGELGHIYTFALGNAFQFHGVLLDHKIQFGSEGRTVSAHLSDGRQYLNNFILIIGKYYGRNVVYSDANNTLSCTSGINIVNALHYLEPGVFSQFVPEVNSCPDSNIDKCASFMLSGADKDGMPALRALYALHNQYLTLPLTSQKLLMNFSGLISTANEKGLYLRLSGNSITALDLIETVCNELGCEFYVYIDTYVGGYSMNIKIIDKSSAISNQYTLRDHLKNNYVTPNNYTSLEYGQEASYEKTRQIVMGAPYRYFVEIQHALQYPIFNSYWNEGFVHQFASAETITVPNITGIVSDSNSPIKIQNFSIQSGSLVENNSGLQPENVKECFGSGVFGTGIQCNHFGGGRIAMVLGEKFNIDQPNAPGSSGSIPGTYKVMFSNLCQDKIDIKYDITDLLRTIELDPNITAKLTQDELLFSDSYDCYFNWCLHHSGSIGYEVGKALYGEEYWTDLTENSLKLLADIFNFQNFDNLKNPTVDLPDLRVLNKKFEFVHKFVRNIYENYYGKEYIVLLDKNITNLNKLNRHEICLKQSYNTSSTTPNVYLYDNYNVESGILDAALKTSGKTGPFVTSDSIAAGAWFVGKNDNTILDLNISELSQYINDDNTISGFVKIGPYRNICKIIGGKTYRFRIDLSGLDINDIFIKGENLYVRASFRDEMYFAKWASSIYIDDNTWVRFSIPKLRLVPETEDDIDIARAQTLIGLVALSHMFNSGAIDTITSGESDKFINQLYDACAGGGIASGTVDGVISNMSVINLAKMSVPGIVPLAVAVPFESNTMIYGPWGYTSNPSGGMDIIDTDLSPWQFNVNPATDFAISWDRMNNAGLSLARYATKGRIYQEKGSVTFPGIPNINIGATLGDGDNVVLTDITISYNSNGATTSLNFETYSPKFGSDPKYIVDTTKDLIADRAAFNQSVRQESIRRKADSIQLKESLISIGGGARGQHIGNNSDSISSEYNNTLNKASPNKILMAGYYNLPEKVSNNIGGADNVASQVITHNYTGSCEDIDNNPFLPTAGPADYDGNSLRRFAFAETHPTYNFDFAQKAYYKNVSIMSLDGIFLPVSINGGPENNLVKYCVYGSGTGLLPQDRPIHSMPPIKYMGLDDEMEDAESTTFDIPINQRYLNPIVSRATLETWGSVKNQSDQGFVIVNIAHGSEPSSGNFTFDTTPNKDGEIAQDKQDSTDFRFSALRGPLVLQSWGYDINGKPIPNANDSALLAESGIFRKTGLKDKFLKNWLGNPKTWPVAPVDLRFDRHRGVWVAPTSNKLIVARLTQALSPYGKAEAELLNPSADGREYYADYEINGENGENLKSDIRAAKVMVYDYLGKSIAKCTRVLLYYEDGKYIVIEEGGFGEMTRVRVSYSNTLECGGSCKGELITVAEGGGLSYGDPEAITIIDTMGIVAQLLPGGTRLWAMKMPDSGMYEVVYIGTRDDANCGSCGGQGVYTIAGVDFNRLPTVAEMGSPLTVTPGGCLAKVGTAFCVTQLSSPGGTG